MLRGEVFIFYKFRHADNKRDMIMRNAQKIKEKEMFRKITQEEVYSYIRNVTGVNKKTIVLVFKAYRGLIENIVANGLWEDNTKIIMPHNLGFFYFTKTRERDVICPNINNLDEKNIFHLEARGLIKFKIARTFRTLMREASVKKDKVMEKVNSISEYLKVEDDEENEEKET